MPRRWRRSSTRATARAAWRCWSRRPRTTATAPARTSATVHQAGGNLGEPGSVAYLFDKRGVIVVDAARYAEDDLLPAIEAGALDVAVDDDVFEILTEPADLTAVRAALERGRRRARVRRALPAPQDARPHRRGRRDQAHAAHRRARGQRRRRRRARQFRRRRGGARTCGRVSRARDRRALRSRGHAVGSGPAETACLTAGARAVPAPLLGPGAVGRRRSHHAGRDRLRGARARDRRPTSASSWPPAGSRSRSSRWRAACGPTASAGAGS